MYCIHKEITLVALVFALATTDAYTAMYIESNISVVADCLQKRAQGDVQDEIRTRKKKLNYHLRNLLH